MKFTLSSQIFHLLSTKPNNFLAIVDLACDFGVQGSQICSPEP